jgi:outer membrane receptor protein involved in Fe transport
LEEVLITAARSNLQGTAATASEGVVTDSELQLTPQYRPGQLLETVPGLIATLHSGEGKANQYLLRGYNLDHGTDLETYVDGMPINEPTHAHGQGYTDLNFMVPELADGIAYTKGPYYADVGDFGAVGSVHVHYRDTIPAEFGVTVGTLGYQRLTAAGTQALAAGDLLAFAELQRYDGAFATPDEARKENLVLRYSQGDAHSGASVSAMIYHQRWTNTTDLPLRALNEGVVVDRFGTLDPTDGGHAQRASLSVNVWHALGAGELQASGFVIDNQLHIYNDYTHFLIDPVHGDQEAQFENRRVVGGTINYTLARPLGALANEFTVGALARYDLIGVGRLPSEAQRPLSPSVTAPSYSDRDQVYLFAGALYAQASTHWTSTLRTVLGLRADAQHGSDVDYLAALHSLSGPGYSGYTNGGTQQQALLQPKVSLVYAASRTLEFYASAGRGFHSADLRGVNQDTSVNLGLPRTPLLARQEGQEVGLRAMPRNNLALTLAVFNLWQQSETIIDPDVGQDVAGPASRRYGYEVNLTYQPTDWLELYGSYSGDHTRFTHAFDDGTGHRGTYITDAPVATGSLALYLRPRGRWSAGLNYRYLGAYALSSGPCVNAAAVHDFPRVATSCVNAPTALGQINARGFGEFNLDAHYAWSAGWTVSLGLYNLLDTHAAAAEFWYVDRLRSEIAGCPEGRADVHQHPLEPTMVRLTLSRRFGA